MIFPTYRFFPERQIKDRERYLANLPRSYITTHQSSALTFLPFSTKLRKIPDHSIPFVDQCKVICPLSSRQVKYLKISADDAYISIWCVSIFYAHHFSLYLFIRLFSGIGYSIGISETSASCLMAFCYSCNIHFNLLHCSPENRASMNTTLLKVICTSPFHFLYLQQ